MCIRDSSDGSLVASNGGGVAPFTYSWDNSSSTSEQATGLSAGSHTVTITDANNCFESVSFTLVEPDVLVPNLEESNYSLTTSGNDAENELSCYGLSDGWAMSNTYGGVTSTIGYQYIWTNDNTGQVVSNQSMAQNLPANASFSVLVTDANGCVASEQTSIYDQPEPFIADISSTNYAGATHAPFSVNFQDNTISAYPYSITLSQNLFTLENPTAVYNPCISFSYLPCNDSIIIITNSNPTFNPDFSYEFENEDIGFNILQFTLTNDATGCMDSSIFNIDVQGISSQTNNVFSPNGDGWNEEFTFGEHGMQSVDVQIFNRWGQLVYSWSGLNKSWDGRGTDGQDLPEAVYFYILKSNGEDGFYYEDKGSITLSLIHISEPTRPY